MNHAFTSAICLVVVLEGLFLFSLPGVWKRMAEQLRQLDAKQLRTMGGVMMVLGVIALKLFN